MESFVSLSGYLILAIQDFRKKQLSAGDLAKVTLPKATFSQETRPTRRRLTLIGQDANQKIKMGDAASYSSNVQCFCEIRLAATLTGITCKKSCYEPLPTSLAIAD